MIRSDRPSLPARLAATALATLLLVGCADEAAEEEALPPSEALPLGLALEPPTRIGPEESSLRIILTNEGEDHVAGAGFELVLPTWLQVGEPTDGELSVREIDRSSIAARTRFRHAGVLRAGDSWTVDQPLSEAAAPGRDAFRGQVVRAWLVDAEGHAFGAGVTATLGRVRGEALPLATPDGIGPARLGAEVDALREAVATRDTAWVTGAERMTGVAIPVAEGLSVLGAVAEGTVVRVRIDDPQLRAVSGAHPGMPLHELRTLYGDPCLVQEAGSTVAVFPTQTGMEFVLEEDERVDHIVIRRTDRDCPIGDRVRAPGTNG